MTNEELVELIRKNVNSSNNLQQLYDQNQPLIRKMAQKLQGYVDMEDLMQEGFIGLYEAVKRYESDKEVKFMTYAPHWIRNAMMCCIERQSSIVTAPRHLRELLYRYRKVVNAFTAQVGRDPNDEELCRYLYISQIQLNSLKQYLYSMNQLESLDGVLAEEGETLLVDTISSGQNMEEEVIDRMMCQECGGIWDIVKENTTEQENNIICMRYRGNMTLRGIGDKMGINHNAVREHERMVLRKLRRPTVRRKLINKFEIVEATAYHSGVKRFKTTWTSSTERAVLKLEEIKNMF